MKKLLRLMSYILVAALASAATFCVTAFQPSDEYEKYLELKALVGEKFIGDIDWKVAEDNAAAGLIAGLGDRWSYYIPASEYASYLEQVENAYVGVGMTIQLTEDGQGFLIIDVTEGGPAEAAGVQVDDILVEIEGNSTVGMDVNQARDYVRGEEGTTVHLTFLRNGAKRELDVERKRIETAVAEWQMLEGDVGYISLYEFSGDCSVAFEQHFNKLMEQGAKALIMDLRDNPGGWVDDAVKVADLFLDKGEVASLRYRDGSEETYTTRDGKVDLPVVLLVNENSASASEILAGCLQDRERATIVGTTTYGKGVVQWVLPIGDRGAGMQLTIAQYFTPNGNEVHKVGITPDVEAIMPEELVSEMYDIGDLNDPQLKVAYDEALKLAQ